MKLDIRGLAPAKKVDGDMKTSDSLLLTLAVPVIGSTFVSLALEFACLVASASMITSYPFALRASISALRFSFYSLAAFLFPNLLTSRSSSDSSPAPSLDGYASTGLFIAYLRSPP